MTFIHLLALNARCIRNKVHDLFFLTTNYVDAVICVSETWLSSQISEELFSSFLKTHQLIRSDRNEFGGGVLLLVPKVFGFSQ